MKRDIEFLRLVLLKIEESDNEIELISEMKNYGHDLEYSYEQLNLMNDAGLFLSPTLSFETYRVKTLSNKGYDLLDKIKNKKNWKKLQQNVEKGKSTKVAEFFGVFFGSLISSFFYNIKN